MKLTYYADDLVIHCAVLAEPGDEANELLEYVVDACPAALEKKNTMGNTPLMVACRLGRVDFVKILLEANADQSTRNAKGENILHAALTHNPKAAQLKPLLDLFDADLRSHLFLQRKNLHENGTTPLHTWVSQACGVQEDNGRYRYNYYSSYNTKPYTKEKDVVDMLKLLLEYSKGEELEMLNGAGDTCLHTAIMNDMVSLVNVLVQFKPRLLYRENAVGRTPAEVAHDRLTGQKFAKPETLTLNKHEKLAHLPNDKPGEYADQARLKNKTPEQLKEMLTKVGLSGHYDRDVIVQILASMGVENNYHGTQLTDKAKKQVIWDICDTAMAEHTDKRRLVSLNEANDVAKRLGEKYTASRYFSIEARNEGEDSADEEEKEEKKKQATDFSVEQLNNRIGKAWKNEEEKDEEKEEDDDEDKDWCDNCGEYH